ncbi:MAG: endolytic transglycosylase MltG [Flavipsychrobacter sp.]
MSRSRFDTVQDVPTSRKRKKSNRWLSVLFALLIILVSLGAVVYYKTFGPNTGSFKTGEYLYIYTGDNYQDLLSTLEREGFVKDIVSFNLLAKQANLPNHVKAGRYKIQHGENNYDLIRQLRSGKQAPVNIVINKVRTKQELAGIIGRNLEADSALFLEQISNPEYLSEFDLDSNTLLTAIIPDTYEFYWNTSADRAFRRLEIYKHKFWNADRLVKAAQKKLSPEKVSIIASIVEEETNNNEEKPLIASVYMNRVRYGMKLQADPTVKFAVGDFTLRRILDIHLNHDSPYNTYMYFGYPPGPICTPSKTSIDAVLNAPETKYLYFCAKEDFSGSHSFASSYKQHLDNASKYHKALNERGIK